MVEKDQAADAPPSTPTKAAQFSDVCKENYPVVAELFRKYGWLKTSEFGDQAASDFWLLSAHQADAHPEFAQKELAGMQKAVSESEANAATYALFYDSVAEAHGRPQHWGTKTVCEGGQRRLYPVDDIEGLARRRDEALLSPEASYISDLPACSK
jgi:hypothetical protein